MPRPGRGAVCPPDTFTCSSSSLPVQCVPWLARCDGLDDCAQGEDEQGCGAPPCTREGCAEKKGPAFIMCENQLQRVAKRKWCDGQLDCMDGTDEKYC